MMPEPFDRRICELGEGPLWHPQREALFWFDIVGQRLLARERDKESEWRFDRPVSAGGWIDHDALLVAGAGALMRFDIAGGGREVLCPLDPERPGNRSNDGRADPWGGFWIGTMGLQAEQGAGSIWRYHRGEMRRLFGGMTIPNAIAFAPDAGHAVFADSSERKVWRQRLGADGWPVGEPEVFLDLVAEGLTPDGAVFDADGCLWLALWGSSRVARYDGEGRLMQALTLPVAQPTCPAFGGVERTVLHVTSARENLTAGDLAAQPLAGCVFRFETGTRGLEEPRVIL